jgi:hypothetical protein
MASGDESRIGACLRIGVGSICNRRAKAVPEFRKVMRRRIIFDGD